MERDRDMGVFLEDDDSETHDAGSTRSPSTVPPMSATVSRSLRSVANSSSSSYGPNTSTTNNNSGGNGNALPALQTRSAADHDGLEPLAEEEADPASFDLVVPAHGLEPLPRYSLEARSELLFSPTHLRAIFDDPALLRRFAEFLRAARPASVPLLRHYLDALKALRAIRYANAIAASSLNLNNAAAPPVPGLRPGFVADTVNESLAARAREAFAVLAREDLPAYVTHTWIRIVSATIKRRIADTLPVHLRDLSQGLAEVFCLTDPSRPDNPIVFASEEFHKTTQYGMDHVLGRNCRFLQGPRTDGASVRRIRERLAAGREHCETFVNYRRDGSPFMNLLMVAPLYDSRGVVRYHIGAQVDVSGLARECAGLDALQRLVARYEEDSDNDVRDGSREGAPAPAAPELRPVGPHQDEFRELAEMFNAAELKTVREAGGAMHRVYQDEVGEADGGGGSGGGWHRPRILIKDEAARPAGGPTNPAPPSLLAAPGGEGRGGRLSGVFEHYLLVRPHPNLRILFASPSLRVPGMLQSSFTSRIGGSARVRDAVVAALAEGRGVTAKIRWISPRHRGGYDDAAAAGRSRWIHCTPLLGGNGSIGVWMVVLVDDEAEAAAARRTRDAPPVVVNTGGGGDDDARYGILPQRRVNRRDGRSKYGRSEDIDIDIDIDGEDGTDDDQMSLSSFAAAQRAPIVDARFWPHPPTQGGRERERERERGREETEPRYAPPLPPLPPPDVRSVRSNDDVGPPPTSPLPPRPGKSLQSGLRHLFSKHGKEYGSDADRRAGRVIVEPGMGDNAWLGSLR